MGCPVNNALIKSTFNIIFLLLCAGACMPPAPMIPHPQQLATGVFPIFPPINQDLSMFASLQAGADGSEDNPGYTGLQQPTAKIGRASCRERV